jgi:hypothetical protein
MPMDRWREMTVAQAAAGNAETIKRFGWTDPLDGEKDRYQ